MSPHMHVKLQVELEFRRCYVKEYLPKTVFTIHSLYTFTIKDEMISYFVAQIKKILRTSCTVYQATLRHWEILSGS